MTTFDRFDPFERRIGDAIHEIAAPRTPDYLTDVLRQTARTAQRPRWSFLERWLPVGALARQGLLADGVRLRPLLLFALLALLALAAIGAALIQDRPVVVPPPFGPAGNGLLAFSVAGDLYLGDATTGGSRLLASGVGSQALFDRTGTRIATVRTNPPNTVCYGPPPVPPCSLDILITTIDGRTTVITDTPLPYPELLRDWSADGRSLLVAGWQGALSIVPTDGSGVRAVGASEALGIARLAPPDAASIWTDEAAGTGFRPVRVDLQGRPLTRFPTLAGRESLEFAASPDGTRLAIGGAGSTLAIVDLDGAVERVIELGPGIVHVGWLSWSPNGSSIVLDVLTNGQLAAGPSHLVNVVDPEGIRPTLVVHRPVSSTCSWAPDGTALLCAGGDDDPSWYLVDLSGRSVRMSWPGDQMSYVPSWQRLPMAPGR